MGANAQTSVPVFTSGQVLTAQQQTEINTGIPVFATSVERDAAFGGTGLKTLAEGQFAFLEDTDATQYYDGSTWEAMTSKKISKAKRQIGDQTTKGGVIGIMIYALSTNNVDPVLIGLLVPVASSVLAWISTKIGDPDLACLFIPNDDDKPKN
jgi:hypothetical protein